MQYKEEYIEKAKTAHGDRYNYSLLPEQFFSTEKIDIICPIHGIFKQQSNKHLLGRGCPQCSNTAPKNLEYFLKKAKETHGDLYVYDNFKFVNMKTKGEIYCPKHDILFMQSPIKHISGQGCPKCRYEKASASKTKTNENFIMEAKKVHGDRYIYNKNKVKYKHSEETVTIVCPKHGEFSQTPKNHLRGQGCPKCGRESTVDGRKLTTEKFIEIATKKHHNKYDYAKVNYIDSNTKIIIICPKHGEFLQTPSNHLFGQGCPICKSSKLELFIQEVLTKNNIDFIPQYKFPNILPKRYSVDFYLPNKNIVIECQGKQHFNPHSWGKDKKNENEYNKIVHRDKLKYELLTNNGIKLLYFSNLGIEYPYKVIENIDELLNEINNE